MINILKRLLILGAILVPNIAFAQTCIGTPPLTQIVVNNTIDICLPTNNANEISALALRQVLQTMTSAIFNGTGGPVSFVGPLTVGNTPFAQADVYTGGPSLIFSARGTTLVPVTDNGATEILQSVSNITSGSGQTLYVSLVKVGMAATDSRAIWAECNDTAGGANSSISCARFSGVLSGGTGGNGTAVTASFACVVSYAFCGGVEGQIFNNNADATTSFSASNFETSFLASNAGTKKSFSAFQTNPNGATAAYINGFYVAAGTVQDSIVRSDAATAYGINFLNATCTTASYRSTNYILDCSGNVTGNGSQFVETLLVGAPITAAAGQISYGGTTANTSNCGSLMSAIACIVVNVAGTTHYIPYY